MRNNTLLVVLVSALVAGVVGYGGARMANPASTVAAHQETPYERIVRTGKLRCGYVIYPVSLVRDPNTGAFSGISYDIITQLGKELGLTVEWVEETSGALMTEALKTDRFDLVCTSMWSSSARGKAAQFSAPVYFTAINAYARKDDDRFNNLTSFNSPELTIATVDGSMSAAITRDDDPLAKTYALPDLTDFPQLFVAVKDKKADLTYSEEAQAADFESKNPDVLRNITPDKPVRLFANRFVMKMQDGGLSSMLNNAIANLQNSGFIEKVVANHTSPNAYRRVTRAYQ